jgi:hypothetical protein
MIQKAHEISLEAGSKMATAMKNVIFAAAGLTPFAAESAKDLINYMVRRGQMGAEEAERILRDIEDAADKRGGNRPVVKPAVKEEPKMAAAPPAFNRPSFSAPPSQAAPHAAPPAVAKKPAMPPAPAAPAAAAAPSAAPVAKKAAAAPAAKKVAAPKKAAAPKKK